MRPIRRRTFLGAAAAGLIGARLPTSVPGYTKRATARDLVGELFSDAAAVRRIGTAYLPLAPAEASEAALLTLLAPEGEDPTTWWGSIDVDELRTEMRRRVHADFEASDVVDLGAWQLARTELRLAALWTVTHP